MHLQVARAHPFSISRKRLGGLCWNLVCGLGTHSMSLRWVPFGDPFYNFSFTWSHGNCWSQYVTFPIASQGKIPKSASDSLPPSNSSRYRQAWWIFESDLTPLQLTWLTHLSDTNKLSPYRKVRSWFVSVASPGLSYQELESNRCETKLWRLLPDLTFALVGSHFAPPPPPVVFRG